MARKKVREYTGKRLLKVRQLSGQHQNVLLSSAPYTACVLGAVYSSTCFRHLTADQPNQTCVWQCKARALVRLKQRMLYAGTGVV
jgi:hypothetical protein